MILCSPIILARRPMVELLFARLPPTMRSHAISRLARFVTTNTLPSVTQEAAILCNAAGWADPDAAASLLLEPLLEQLEAELPALQRVKLSTGADVSKVSTLGGTRGDFDVLSEISLIAYITVPKCTTLPPCMAWPADCHCWFRWICICLMDMGDAPLIGFVIAITSLANVWP